MPMLFGRNFTSSDEAWPPTFLLGVGWILLGFLVLRALRGVVSSVVYEPNAVCWPEEVSLFLVTSSSCTGHSSCASAVKF